MASLSPLDLDNIQGDILEGLAKKNECFFFFRIKTKQVSAFRRDLSTLLPLVTSVTEAKRFHGSINEAKREAAREGRKCQMLEMHAVNIAFSQKGLDVLGIGSNGSIGDPIFENGMRADAGDLGDDLSDWDDAFNQDIHGVIIIAASCDRILQRTVDRIKGIFQVGHRDSTVEEVLELSGHTRPGAESGHEQHTNFFINDGLSQPAVRDVDAGVISELNQDPIAQGVILLGRDGDNGDVTPGGPPAPGITRPAWAVDGSFLAFRYLKQLVPEFDAFCEANALKIPFPPAPGDPTGAELLGARLVGRWKSGAPTDLTPIRDDPSLAKSEDFRFDPNSQERCPFAAHIRKTNPRSDLDQFGGTEIRRILRRGIAFGPEVTDEEKRAKKSSDSKKLERGLLFACYQSNLSNGFHFMQQSWANTASFPPKAPAVPEPGIDPIIGVAPAGALRQMVGTSPDAADANVPLDFAAKWVIPLGGEYFFSPSISALKSTFAAHGRHGHHEL
ncbi:Dyp-type peroxidase [Xylariaceae sp. FL1272]|nr:Dyp-type peroxidase [Xylariaceae sp. FL1272]